MFTFGIEHEVAFLDRSGQFSDFLSASFDEFDAIIARLPFYEEDYPRLVIGDAGIRLKRWYMEGLERFDGSGRMLTCLIKGIEIRTTPHQTILGTIEELTTSFRLLCQEIRPAGLVPVLTSFHPYRTEFVPDSPFNAFEEALLHQSPEDLSALLSMLTYGPDLNISCQGMSTEAIIDVGRKFTYYSPYIVPFTYSSPFYAGKRWEGLSMRTFLRTGLRPAAMVFLKRQADLRTSNPSLTKIARIPGEIGRIEFKACDSCDDFMIYAALLAVLKGLLLDTTLTGRATVPNASMHQVSAQQGFANEEIVEGTQAVLHAVEQALRYDEDMRLLGPLHTMLAQRTTPAHRLLHTFQITQSIEESLLQTYPLFIHDRQKSQVAH